tara:strand:- start:48 stop:362 length:315 start_codon:yes stop_codon:yes gene_type:complete
MIIETVKTQENSYLVNGTMSVPNDPANRDCADVLAWIEEGNTPDPQFTPEEIAANAQQVINGESLAYLASTDWYITRQSETDVAVPQAILTLRAAARVAVVTGA